MTKRREYNAESANQWSLPIQAHLVVTNEPCHDQPIWIKAKVFRAWPRSDKSQNTMPNQKSAKSRQRQRKLPVFLSRKVPKSASTHYHCPRLTAKIPQSLLTLSICLSTDALAVSLSFSYLCQSLKYQFYRSSPLDRPRILLRGLAQSHQVLLEMSTIICSTKFHVFSCFFLHNSISIVHAHYSII